MREAATQTEETLIHLCGEWLTPLPEAALWWETKRTLIVSDLHFEKGSSYARRGQMLPPYDTSATLSCIEALAARFKPETIISLGDSFHDRAAELRLSQSDTARICALTAAHDWVWVEGNHDPDPPQHLGGRAEKTLRIGPLIFRHEPTGETGEVSGHLHPVAKVSGRGRSVRRKAFVANGEALVMPSLGAFTGGLNVLDPAFARLFDDGSFVFVVGAGRVHGISRKRLVPDGPRRGAVWSVDTKA